MKRRVRYCSFCGRVVKADALGGAVLHTLPVDNGERPSSHVCPGVGKSPLKQHPASPGR